MNLLEIVIVVGILVALFALAFPAANWLFRLDQKKAASTLASQYRALRDEAMLNNRSFRVAYHLDDSYYEIEVGGPGVLLFKDPEQREQYEAELADKLTNPSRFQSDPSELVSEDGQSLKSESFAALNNTFYRKVQLPMGTVFGGVYTPQYGDLVEPEGLADLDPDQKTVVYSYIMPNGFSEHTVVQLVTEGRPDVGWTIEVEPMTGKVHLRDEIGDWKERFAFVPAEGPELAE